MQIIAHRINTVEGLKQVPKEYGTEIDIRAWGDKLILTHEPHEEAEDFEEYLKAFDHAFCIFNIKEAGIEDRVINLAEKHNVKDYFLLDVEFPYLYRATRKDGKRNIAVRFSEAEPIEMSLAQTGLLDWVWVDTNTVFPMTKEQHDKLREAGFKLCLVCPERWGRPDDIKKYRDYMKQNGIKMDAVMTALKYVPDWTQ